MTALNPAVTGRDDWTTVTFEAITTKGAVTVAGMVRGFFGIHRPDQKGPFHLTHLPTGCCVGRADEGHRLVLVAARFKDAADWDFSDLNGLAGQGVADKLRRILLDHNAFMAAQVDEAEAA
jgi:hypothetical protein